MKPDLTTIQDLWGTYGQYALIGALGLALLALIATIRRVTRLKPKAKDHDLLSSVVTLMVLALTAEGMFWVLTTKLSMPLPWWLAIFVCAVAEGLMVNFFRLAKQFNATHGRPGPFGTAFWIVAVAEGAIVALASSNVVEIALRILLPLGVALLHWIKLTADGSQENRGRFLWTPLNLLIRLGAWKPGKTTVDEAEAKRFEDKLTKAAYMLASARFGKDRKLRKVRRMMLEATPKTADRVIAHLQLAYGVEARIVAVTTTGSSAVRSAAQETITAEVLEPGREETRIEIPSTPLPTPTSPISTSTVERPINGHRVNNHPAALPSSPGRRASTTMMMSVTERDTDIAIRYWDVLTGLIQAGTLCRSAIERACTVGNDKVLARQANRLLDIITCAYTLSPDMEVEDRVATAIQMIAAGQAGQA